MMHNAQDNKPNIGNSNKDCVEEPGQRDLSISKCMLNPASTSAMTISRYAKVRKPIDVGTLIDELSKQIGALKMGNMETVEGMLLAQAHTLNHIFSALAQRAVDAPYLELSERCLRLALKAQNQSRTTLETLGAIKNPASVSYVRQANIGNAVQVNNGSASQEGAPTGFANENVPNELLEPQHEEQRLDVGTSFSTSKLDSKLETVGAINGSKVNNR